MKVDFTEVFGITITGLVVVFIALILLILIMWIMGRGVSILAFRKKTPSKKDLPAKIDAKPIQQPPANDDSVVAAITAAITCYRGANRPFSIRQIKAVSPNETSAWKIAGLQQNIQPFEGGNR